MPQHPTPPHPTTHTPDTPTPHTLTVTPHTPMHPQVILMIPDDGMSTKDILSEWAEKGILTGGDGHMEEEDLKGYLLATSF